MKVQDSLLILVLKQGTNCGNISFREILAIFIEYATPASRGYEKS